MGVALLVVVAVLLFGVLVVEVAARWSRVSDVPLFNVDKSFGHMPKPTQSGRFRRRYDWCFNDRGMGVADPFDAAAPDGLVLVGDSIVFGQLKMRQADRLGPVLGALTGAAVWPIASPGWSLQNALAFLETTPDLVASAREIVLVLNSGDFKGANSWGSEANHPRFRHASAVYLVAYKLARKTRLFKPSTEFKVAHRDWQPMLAALAAATTARFVVALYPHKAETEDRGLAQTALLSFGASISEILGPEAVIIDIGADPEWTPAFYVDGVHPNAAGTRRLAKVIAAARNRQMEQSSLAA
ncbi:hypothetical protein LB518_15625 [Mesorhizobium sp. BR1-1-16]|uniref:hypothetical protein n=1 Tax=Mesorhizobium sp. BR1-1-16 TaxID=2876653 RepID=UPI001CC95182|nr:hypothetical protein [Mesorhizobium sp. BR1-1-16]MBZ9937730.1 hypothetical protein [Mesorhizobium sp. BR1-1-16]